MVQILILSCIYASKAEIFEYSFVTTEVSSYILSYVTTCDGFTEGRHQHTSASQPVGLPSVSYLQL